MAFTALNVRSINEPFSLPAESRSLVDHHFEQSKATLFKDKHFNPQFVAYSKECRFEVDCGKLLQQISGEQLMEHLTEHFVSLDDIIAYVFCGIANLGHDCDHPEHAQKMESVWTVAQYKGKRSSWRFAAIEREKDDPVRVVESEMPEAFIMEHVGFAIDLLGLPGNYKNDSLFSGSKSVKSVKPPNDLEAKEDNG